MNFETSWLAYLGSGSITRFGISLRRGMVLSKSLLSGVSPGPRQRVRNPALTRSAGSFHSR
jgi:hypothetical protein